MNFQRQTRLPARLANDWVRFVIRRNSSHFPPIRDRSGLTFFPGRLSHFRPAPIGSAAQPQALFGNNCKCAALISSAPHQANACHSERSEESIVPRCKTDSSARAAGLGMTTSGELEALSHSRTEPKAIIIPQLPDPRDPQNRSWRGLATIVRNSGMIVARKVFPGSVRKQTRACRHKHLLVISSPSKLLGASKEAALRRVDRALRTAEARP